ncbi:complement C3-like [Bos indicus x Bos taurus]|uniref:complement C3-like n=1 Tax=Bos indicus x Bos taurus TaxID=30522 RepID=UPI000F7D2D23|nr:complement C3-like [Bos indicus x Bos taurus]
MDVPWGLGLLLLLLGIPIAQAEPLYILVTPRVLRIGSPETIHVEAHSDSSEPLSHPLEVNLSVWDFPMKNTRVARRELVLSKENHFMDQASVTKISE